MSKRPATLKDVAAAAGVSTATVSMILNQRYQFKPEVEARVREAIVKLNYRQNPVARSMVTGTFGSIGLVVLDIRNPHFTNVVYGANLSAQAHDYNVVVADLKEDTSNAFKIIDDLARRVDGMILSLRIPQAVRELPLRLGKPTVMFGQTLHDGSQPVPTPSILIQGYEAALLLGRHLSEAGAKNVMYVGYERSLWNKDRGDALREAMQGAQIYETIIDNQTMEAGEALATSIVYGSHKVDAIVCYNDVIAIGLLHGLWRLGVRVPEDMLIAGFDNIPVARYVTPSLTTVDMRSEDMGRCAVESLHHMIESNDQTPVVEMLEPRLIVRGSTSSAAAKASLP